MESIALYTHIDWVRARVRVRVTLTSKFAGSDKSDIADCHERARFSNVNALQRPVVLPLYAALFVCLLQRELNLDLVRAT